MSSQSSFEAVSRNEARSGNLRRLVTVAMLSAIATVLMIFEFPLFFAPNFYKLDFSDLPAILGAFSFGPLYGVLIELFKNLLHFVVKGTSTGGVGELGNFLVGAAFVIPAGLFYKRKKSKKSALIGLVCGTVCMTATGALMNYFVLIPFYVNVMHFPLEAILSMASEVNKFVTDLRSMIVFAVTPFNLFKSIMLSILTMLLYKRLSPILHGVKKS